MDELPQQIDAMASARQVRRRTNPNGNCRVCDGKGLFGYLGSDHNDMQWEMVEACFGCCYFYPESAATWFEDAPLHAVAVAPVQMGLFNTAVPR